MAVEEQLQWTLKTIYPDGRPKFLGWEDAPLLSMVKKRPDFGGKEWKWAAYHGQPQNRSADPLTAFTGDHQQTGKEFVINRVQNYSSFRIQRETIMASMKVGSDSYIDDLKSGIDGTMNQFMLDTYYDLFLDGSGVRGSIGGIGNASGAYVAGDDIANTVITLSDVSRAIYFEEGQVLCFATAQTTGNVKDGAAGKETFVTNSPVVIRAVNYIEGTIQVNKDLSLLNTAVTVGDFIFHQGDRNKKPKGLDAWCPAVDPTQGENFFGVDR
ncbi:MAG: hypothetical protein ACO2ZP_09015, partial [Bacteriovoracaceae bacterium]